MTAALATILALLALALAASAALNPGPLLLLAVVALAVRAVEGIYAWAESRRSVSAVTRLVPRNSAPPAYPGEQIIAVVYPYRGRLRLRRRRA